MAGDRGMPVIDVGGGASLLADCLAGAGFSDVTVLDISAEALAASRRQDRTGTVSFLRADVLGWRPPRRWQVWHDRAVFHFLTSLRDLRRIRGGEVVPQVDLGRPQAQPGQRVQFPLHSLITHGRWGVVHRVGDHRDPGRRAGQLGQVAGVIAEPEGRQVHAHGAPLSQPPPATAMEYGWPRARGDP